MDMVRDKNVRLKEAVIQGDYQLVEQFLAVDMLDVNFNSDKEETCLHMAIARNDVSMVRLLLKFKPDLNPILNDSIKHSPLWLAMLCSYDEIFELLVRSGANVNESLDPDCTCGGFFNYGGKTLLLHEAVVRKDEDKVRLLLEYGADVNKMDRDIDTALHCAVSHKYVAIASLLIRSGANIEAIGIDGITPFHSALMTGNSEIAELMMGFGANVSAIDKSGKNALHFVAEAMEENLILAKKLVNMGIPLDQAENANKMLPLHVALLAGRNELAKLFVKYGTNVNARIRGGAHSLSLAVVVCKTETLRYLINKGANVNSRTDNGETALHRAARLESADKVELLLKQGADVNIKDAKGLNVLAHTKNTSKRTAKVLVGHIAKMKSENAFIDSTLLETIWHFKSLRVHFEQCYKENLYITEEQFYPNYTLRNLLDTNDKELAILARNEFFVKAFESIDFKTKLPVHGEEIITKFREAEKAKNLFLAMEKYINLLFCYSLPSPIVQKIVEHLEQQDLPGLDACMA